MTATHVNPGDPLTAEVWNDLVDAVNGIPQAIEDAMPTSYGINIVITNPGIDLSAVRIVALKSGETAKEAIAPTAPGDPHVLDGLIPGAYTIRAIADGFVTKEESATIVAGNNPDLEMALTPSAVILPDLFGMSFKKAKTMIDSAGLSIGTVRDFSGTDYVPTDPGDEVEKRPVLVQSPAVGTRVPAGGKVHLVVAVENKDKSVTTVPPIIGMTLTEATAELAKHGLSVGDVNVMNEPPTP